MADILKSKDYPLNYPRDVLHIIDTMSMTDGRALQMVGSMSLKSQQYAGDYDMIESVKGNYKDMVTAIKAYVKQFQGIVRSLMKERDVTVGDIKAGIVEEWIVIPDSAGVKGGKVVAFDVAKARAKIEQLHSNDIITSEEYKYAKGALIDNPSIEKFLIMKKELRFHLIRWTPDEVLKGVCTLRDGSQMTLAEAFNTPTIIKLDVVGWVQNNRFTDFSIIYLLFNKGQAINKVDTSNELFSIKQDLLYFLETKNYFKASKRLFSLARKTKDMSLVMKLNDMMNSDMGRLYSIISDCGSLIYLLENETHLDIEKIQYELDQFRSRLGNIYSIDDVGSDNVLKKLVSAEGLPKTAGAKKELLNTLLYLQKKFETVLTDVSLTYMRENKIVPIPKKYLP